MRETGNLIPSHRDAERPRTKRTLILEETALEEVDENPNNSIRNLAPNLHVSSSLILKQEKYHPYDYTKIQASTREQFSSELTSADSCNSERNIT
ncbi:hypothetical protein BDFB_014712 [Asbolus verrucosus]|uniref:Uncharacterized protein n=1 Tax=Asbolus verrucosus TaxID=1661398 RepID=A0A482VRW7_ASBVE|nr:hypothetical protein BDFB_014712 [Asbolus verrucosus]